MTLRALMIEYADVYFVVSVGVVIVAFVWATVILQPWRKD